MTGGDWVGLAALGCLVGLFALLLAVAVGYGQDDDDRDGPVG